MISKALLLLTNPTFAAALLLGGCASFPENEPRQAGLEEAGYRYEVVQARTNPAQNAPDTLVLLAFSGGGTRAAAMAYGVLEELRGTCVTIEGRRTSLLDEVDVISANSGGSYAAAYYAAFRDATFGSDSPPPCDGDPVSSLAVKDAEIPPFAEVFLDIDFEGSLLRSLLNPYSLTRLLSVNYNRSDLAAEVLDSSVFRGVTFGDLERVGKPFLVINAHDVVQGSRFQFSQDYFDYLCSDLGSFPLARAVLASSAVHGAFDAIRLRNYPSDNCPEPAWVAEAWDSKHRERDRWADAKMVRIYREKECWDGADRACGISLFEPHYVRLNDGGAVDNLALHSLLLALSSTDPDMSFMRARNVGEVERTLLISVNAASDPDSNLPLKRTDVRPSVLIRSAVGAAIDGVSAASLRAARDRFRRAQEQADIFGDRIHDPVLIGFDDVPDPAQARCLKNIGTHLTLPRGEVQAARLAGRRLLRSAPAFAAFVQEYDGKVADHGQPDNYCGLISRENEGLGIPAMLD